LLRFVVALDAALDPQKYRQEYLKKLYQLLQPKSQNDITSYFAQYAAGLLPKDALKGFVKQQQLQRNVQRGAQDKNWWNVKYGNAAIEVVASSEMEAKNKAKAEWNLPTIGDNALTATVVRPYKEELKI
jgi:hypothetical protein